MGGGITFTIAFAAICISGAVLFLIAEADDQMRAQRSDQLPDGDCFPVIDPPKFHEPRNNGTEA